MPPRRVRSNPEVCARSFHRWGLYVWLYVLRLRLGLRLKLRLRLGLELMLRLGLRLRCCLSVQIALHTQPSRVGF